jgi:hypothetical protein
MAPGSGQHALGSISLVGRQQKIREFPILPTQHSPSTYAKQHDPNPIAP